MKKWILAFFLSSLCLISQSGLPLIIAHCHQSNSYTVSFTPHNRCSSCCKSSKAEEKQGILSWEKASCCEWSKQYLKCDNSIQPDGQIKSTPHYFLSLSSLEISDRTICVVISSNTNPLQASLLIKHHPAYLSVFRC